MSTFNCPNSCDSLCEASFQEKVLFQYVYYPALTKAERALIAANPKEALKAYRQKNLAEDRTNIYFPKGTVNDESDAFRHFTWAGLLFKELGAEKAQAFLDAHESNRYQSEEAKGMDLANNRAGLLAASKLLAKKRLNLKNLEEEVLAHFREQKLVVLNKHLVVPEGVKK